MTAARILVIVGPTATGKSEIAVRAAQRLGGCEIISADSMQIYRGMDIGTAKPGPELTDAVPHHLLDIVDPVDDFSVAEFQKLSRRAVSEITGRGRLPILAGGTGLYVRAAIDPLDFTAEPPGSRRRLELEALGERDENALLELLKHVDPEAVAHLDLGNRRRLIRAIEAAETTGKSLQERRKQWTERRSIYDVLMVGLAIPREQLIHRIERRVDFMVSSGLIREAEALLAAEGGLSRTAAQALGYKELFAFLRGEQALTEAVDLIKVRTRQFAKRQMTWFRADPRINWIDIGEMDADVVADRIVALVKARQFIVS